MSNSFDFKQYYQLFQIQKNKNASQAVSYLEVL